MLLLFVLAFWFVILTIELGALYAALILGAIVVVALCILLCVRTLLGG